MRITGLAALALVLAACGSSIGSGPNRASGVAVLKAPLPRDAGARYVLSPPDIACASSDCVAAATLYGRRIEGLLFVERHGSWTLREAPIPPKVSPGSQTGVELDAVSCPAAGHCVAVGAAHTKANLGLEKPLILTQHGSRWREAVLRLPANATTGDLTLVSCPSAGECTAAGTYTTTNNTNDRRVLLETETGGRWTAPVKVRLPANAASSARSFGGDASQIDSLSCAAPGYCAAVGIYMHSKGGPQGLLLTEKGGRWSRGMEAQLPPNAASGKGSDLYPVIGMGPVSCAARSECAAVGGYADDHSNQFGMTLTEHGGRWEAAREVPLPSNAGPNEQQGNTPASPLFSIDCPAPGNCSAAGSYVDEHGIGRGLLLMEHAGSWKPSELAPSSSSGGAAGALTCTSTGSCLAAGYYDTRLGNSGLLNSVLLLVRERKGVWQNGAVVKLPANIGRARNGNLTSISCPTAGACTAVGNYVTGPHGESTGGLIVTIPR